MQARSGSYVPLITPLRKDSSLDKDGLGRLVDHVLGAGCAGVLALGSAGENVAVGPRVRQEVLACVSEAIGSRGEFMAGVAQSSLDDAIAEVEWAAEAGARALVVTPPYYGPTDDRTIEGFYVALAERCPVPLLAYNIPAFTGVQVPPAVIRRLVGAGVLTGIKDSGRDLEYFQQVLEAVGTRPGVSVLMGSDTLILPALLLGASGAVSIAANIVPEWTSTLCHAVAMGDIARAQDIQRRLTRVTFALRTGVFPAGAKAALAMLGICGATCAPPVEPLSAAGWQKLSASLLAEGVITEPVGPIDSTERRTG